MNKIEQTKVYTSTDHQIKLQLTNDREDEIVFGMSALSLRYIDCHQSKRDEGLCLRYRKMLSNMKMVKSFQKCTICLQPFEKDEIIKKFPCKHILHRQCAKDWLKTNKKCPLCRLDLHEYYKQLEQNEGHSRKSVENI